MPAVSADSQDADECLKVQVRGGPLCTIYPNPQSLHSLNLTPQAPNHGPGGNSREFGEFMSGSSDCPCHYGFVVTKTVPQLILKTVLLYTLTPNPLAGMISGNPCR